MKSESPSTENIERQTRPTATASDNDFTLNASPPSLDLPVDEFLAQLDAWSLPPLELPVERPAYEAKLQAWCKRFEPVTELYRSNRLLRGHVQSLLVELENPGWRKDLIADHENREAIQRAREYNDDSLRNQSENDAY